MNIIANASDMGHYLMARTGVAIDQLKRDRIKIQPHQMNPGVDPKCIGIDQKVLKNFRDVEVF